MLVYFQATEELTESILQEGWKDRASDFGLCGVYATTVPPKRDAGCRVTLRLDVPAEEFERFDMTDDLQATCGYRLALLPTELLNRLGPPEVYDHVFAGVSRRELLERLRQYELLERIRQFEQCVFTDDTKRRSDAIVSLEQMGRLTTHPRSC